MRSGKVFSRLLAGIFLCGVTAGFVAPANAQTAKAGAEAGAESPVTPAASTDTDNEKLGVEEVIVTGSLFTRTNTETASPVTTLSAESLARRGLTNISDAVRSLSSDNSGSIPNSFTAGFATGASGVSLRGLTVNSTLVLFDGQRGAYYPLPDDGQRSFVDLNTIPDVVIDRIEVLRDGASSIYGADAIGGVVNVITKREFQGIQTLAESGLSSRGDARELRFSLLAGTGNLSERGWNAYVGAEYYHADSLANKDRGFPFNTFNLSSLTCDTCLNFNAGVTSAGSTISAVVRPAIQPDPNDPFNILNAGSGLFQVVNPFGCAPGTIPHTTIRGDFCEQDLTNQYSQIQPEQKRWGIMARGTFRLANDWEAYVTGNSYQSELQAENIPVALRQSTPFNSTTAVLPVLVCAAGVDCDTAADGRLNPNNPFAAAGSAAQMFYRFGDIPAFTQTTSRTLRGAAGIHGPLGHGLNFSADITAMHTNLDVVFAGNPNIAALTQAINTGSYNFVDPSQNSAALRQALAPDLRTPATSDLYMAQAAITTELAQLPGGPLQLGVGLSARYEATDVTPQNPGPPFQALRLNPFSGVGHSDVEAGYFELNVPVLRRLDANLSGRFDHYSQGFDRFSPKVGVKFTPIPEVAFRGTYSRGFRAPQSFETSGNVLLFVLDNPANSFDVVCTDHGGTIGANGTCQGGSAYTNPGNIGLNSSGNPSLKPETSENYTLGMVLQPTRWFSAALDYYHIKKEDIVQTGPLSDVAEEAYYAGEPLPPGYSVTLNGPDPDFPNGIQTIAQINSPYGNAASLVTDGIDLSAMLNFQLSPAVKLSSTLEVTDILKFDFVPAAGEPTQQFVGTQGPGIVASAAGTPKWRGNWSNSLDVGPATITATISYTSGYFNTAEDLTGAGTGKDCDFALFDPGFCRTSSYTQVDLVGNYKINDKFMVYANVINALDESPPVNFFNVAAVNYNPTYTYGGIIGRMFRLGFKADF